MRADRQAVNRGPAADRIIDRGGDGGAHRVDAAFADALDAQRIERARRVLAQQQLDGRNRHAARQQVIGKARRERLALLVVAELLVERAAEALRRAARDLARDEARIDRTADVVADQDAFRGDLARVAINPHQRDMTP